MTDQTIDVPLTPSQIQFLMDLMMGCSLGITKHHAQLNNVDDSATYNQLQNCLPTDPQHPE